MAKASSLPTILANALTVKYMHGRYLKFSYSLPLFSMLARKTACDCAVEYIRGLLDAFVPGLLCEIFQLQLA